MSAASQPAPGTVKIRICGELPDIATALRVLRDAAEIEGFGFGELSRPYPNRREPGCRVYVTLQFPPDEDTRPCGAAHSHQAIRRPAAPSRRHYP
jgi:hypothetical protein